MSIGDLSPIQFPWSIPSLKAGKSHLYFNHKVVIGDIQILQQMTPCFWHFLSLLCLTTHQQGIKVFSAYLGDLETSCCFCPLHK
jgi:hypothetical protein